MTEGELQSWFNRLLNRAPTADEKRLLLQVQKELGINDDDSLWLVLVILGHYAQLYERIPEKIEVAASFAIEQARYRLDAETEAERKRIQGALTKAVLDTVEQVAVHRVQADRRWGMAIAAGISLMLVIVVGTAGYYWGRSTGEQSANTAQLWSQGTIGKYAHGLSDYGVLQRLLSCQTAGGDFRISRERAVICEMPGGRVDVLGPIPESALNPAS